MKENACDVGAPLNMLKRQMHLNHFPFPGGQPVVSSNGSSNGIVWAVDQGGASSLHAFDANDVSHELFRSPSIGQAAKWAVPTVFNGKVYVATKTQLVVFGLK